MSPIAAAKTRPKAMRVLSMATSPHAALGRRLHVLAKITRRAAKRAPDPVGHVRIATVEHGGKEVEHQFDHLLRHLRVP